MKESEPELASKVLCADSMALLLRFVTGSFYRI
jgi:hypothetical protein